MPQLAIRLLGVPEITLDAQPVAFDTRKAIALLAYLVVTQQSVRRDTLAALLWPESDGKRARSALRRTLAALNSGIGKQWLEATRETITFLEVVGSNRPMVDVHLFAQTLEIVRRDCAQRAEKQADCLTYLEDIAALYRGTFLEGFSLKDSAGFDDWQSLIGEHLRQEFGDALSRLTQAYRQQQDWSNAIRQAQRWLSLDSLAEDAHRTLMMIYSLAGQRPDAVRQYELCVQLLHDELGIEPQPETKALYEQIAAGDIGSEKATPAAKPLYYTLANGLSSFIGREQELADLTELLGKAQCRLVTLVGMGGIGKTRLARAVGRQVIADFKHGVCFVPLETVESAESFLPAIATALNYTFVGATPLLEQLTQFLHNKSLLLILDNLEQLLDATPILSQLLSAAPQIKVLATSQERLNLRGEWVYAVDGLDGQSAAALALFVERAQQVRPNFTADDPAAIAEICRLVDGIPLGIELAASWTQLFPPAEIAQRIAQNSQFLVTTLRDVPERHRSLHAIFEYSWSLLPETSRDAMARLSVFRGGFSEAAAHNVASVDALALMQLVNRSLLTRELNERFAMPPVLRRFVAHKRVDSRPQASHAAYYQQFLLDNAARLKGSEQKAALDALKAEIENLRVAWRWLEKGDEPVADAANALFLLYERLSWFDEGVVAFKDDRFLAQRGALLVRSSDYAAGKLLLERAYLNSDEPTRAFINYYLGIVDEAAQNYDSAETLQAKSLELYRAQNDEWGMSNALNALGNIARLNRQFDVALQYDRDSLRTSEKIGDLSGIARSHHNLAYTYETVDRLDEAQALYQRSIELKRELDNRRGLGLSLNNLGYLLYRQNDLGAAQQQLEEARMLFDELGYQRGLGYVLTNLGHVARVRQQQSQARTLYEAGLAIFQAVGDVRVANIAQKALDELE